MTGRDWESVARHRLERLVAETVSRVRDAADQVERDARGHVKSAAEDQRAIEFQTYPRVAGQVVHTVQTLLFNLPLEGLVDAANDAESARTEKLTAQVERTSTTAEADKMAGAVKALTAMREIAKGWAEQSAEEDKAREVQDPKSAHRQEFRLSDILTMINDAAREVGVEGAIQS